jgi:uncharacterized protein YyaL (SSP411 family)
LQWQNDKPNLESQGTMVLDALMKHNTKTSLTKKQVAADAAINKCFSQMERNFEPKMGGFGTAPKFPQPGQIKLSNMYFTEHTGYVAQW